MPYENEFQYTDVNKLLRENKISSINSLSAISYQGKRGAALNPVLTRPDDPRRSGNPNISEIIAESQDLSAADFLYTKDFGKVPNNRMFIIRRFANPVHDILPPFPPIAKAVGYFQKDIDQLIPSLTLKINWEQVTVGEGGGIMSLDYDTLSRLMSSSGIGLRNNLAEDATEKLLGPIKIMDNVNIRSKGQTSDIQFEYDLKYRMKYIDGVDPKLGLLDALSNVLILTYDKFRFFADTSGRFVYDRHDAYLNYDIGFLTNELRSATRQSIAGIGDKFKELVEMGMNIRDFSISDIVSAGAEALTNFRFGKNMLRSIYQIYSIMTGAPTGFWHITIGNPFSPIITWGNLICTEATITFTNTLGEDDFPDGFDVKIVLQPARPLDRDEISSKFNNTYGGIYRAPNQADSDLQRAPEITPPIRNRWYANQKRNRFGDKIEEGAIRTSLDSAHGPFMR